MEIVELNIYPIKSCRGMALSSVAVDRIGLVGDRRMMLVDAAGRFQSQRELPALATLVPSLCDGRLMVTGPGGDSLTIAIDDDAPLREVFVWGGNAIRANDQGDDAAAWFSGQLHHPVRLVAFGPHARNPIDPDYSTRGDAETAFTDGYPIMAVTRESLDDLNRRLAEPVPMARFRPCVVVGGSAPWGEDEWRVIRLGPLECDVVKPCARCVITTTDQLTGARHALQEPLRTLARFRTIPGLGAIFGQNIIPRNTGTLRIGDPVQLM